MVEPARPDRTAEFPFLGRCVRDPALFLEQSWSAAPSVYRGAAGDFTDVFSLNELDQIVAMGSLRSPRLRLVSQGTSVPGDTLTRTTWRNLRGIERATTDSARVAQCVRQGFTLVIDAVEQFSRGLFVLCTGLEIELSHMVTANIYLTPPSSQGLKPHVDGHDVFILQIDGSKQWQVFDRAPGPVSRSTHLSGEEALLVETELRAGDSLYIPRGFGHCARCLDTPSLHITLAVLAASPVDFLRYALEHVGPLTPLSEALPAGFARPATASAYPVTADLPEQLTRSVREFAAYLADPQTLTDLISGFTRTWRHRSIRDRPGNLTAALQPVTPPPTAPGPAGVKASAQ
jgi:bifunctional lysine-specific demethylase and histidyl-hydroxylase NO66